MKRLDKATTHPPSQRVVFVETYPHVFTGAQRATLLLATELADRGWHVKVLATMAGPYVDAARTAGLEVTILEAPRALQRYGGQTRGVRAVTAALVLPWYWLRLGRWFRRADGIVHIADHRGQIIAGPAARLARLPVVWHVHSLSTNRVLNRLCSRLADRVVVPSRTAVDRMPALESRRAVAVVPYALPPAALAPAAGSCPRVPTLVTVGRLHPDKGIDVLLRAVALLRPAVPDVRVIVAGGPQRGVERHHDELVALRRDLGLDAVVELPGHVERVAHLLASASVYVQPSRERTELQPIAILEAMAAGVPVVATAVGAVPEQLGGGTIGTLVPPEDPAALARAIAAVLAAPAHAHEMAAQAAVSVRASATSSRMTDQIIEVYTSL
ncbi:MAG: hypothetical protein QOI95_3454 [Acidimicrobiaceae bacterium]|jgi:glycosyltransferase involved in cell wall biosynthesis